MMAKHGQPLPVVDSEELPKETAITSNSASLLDHFSAGLAMMRSRGTN